MTRISRLRYAAWMSLATLVVSLTTFVQPASAATSWVLKDIVYLQNAKSGLCLAIPSGSTTNGIAAIQWNCNTKAEQLWRIYLADGVSGGYFKIINHATGKCLGVSGGSDVNGREVIQWPCNDSTQDQRWLAIPCEPGDEDCRNIRRKDLFLCMAVPGGSTTNGAHIIQWNCNASNPDQTWIKF